MGRQRTRWLDNIIDSRHESEQTSGDSEGQGSLGHCSPWDCIHTHTHTHTHTHIYACIFVYTWIHTFAYVFIYIYVVTRY